MQKTFGITSEFYMFDDLMLPVSVHRPKEKTKRSEIAIIGTHAGEYILHFSPLVELAKQGFVTAGDWEPDRELSRMEFIRKLADYEHRLDEVIATEEELEKWELD